MNFEKINYPKRLTNDQLWLFKCIEKFFLDKSNNVRVISTSSILRGLIDIVIFDEISSSNVKKCEWYKEETKEKGQVTKSQKMRYSLIHGIHSFEFYKILFIEDTEIKMSWKSLEKIYKNLNENIHFKDIKALRFKTVNEIDEIIKKQFFSTLNFFNSYDLVESMVIKKITDYLEKHLKNRLSISRPDDIWDLEILGEIHNVDVEVVRLLKFDKNSILFESTGKCFIDYEIQNYKLQGTMSTDTLSDIDILWGKKKNGSYIPFEIIRLNNYI